METDGGTLVGGGAPELNTLGKRLELLRIERGISKQQLAKLAGTSRQQLWRVMTGKSELTTGLCQRLAEVLQVDSRELREWCGGGNGRLYTPRGPAGPRPAPQSFAEFATDPDALLQAVRALPRDAAGRRLARELLNCVEVVAAETGVRLTGPFFQIRARVVNGDL
jgi:transcriptional regulator with XRE-family HTH domain